MLLAGCTVPHQNLRSASATAAIQPTKVSATEPARAPQPAVAAVAAKPAVVTPLEATPVAAEGNTQLPTALRLSGDPNELVGLDHAVVRRALGDPARIRTELPAQVWQYVTGDCVVDLYLYSKDGALKVTYVEARSHTAEAAPTGRCLKSLLERPTASAQ